MLIITANNFTAAIVLEDDLVVEAAPIVKYMIGWTKRKVLNYCMAENWQCQETDVG